jgi:type VI secretion system protein VasI
MTLNLDWMRDKNGALDRKRLVLAGLIAVMFVLWLVGRLTSDSANNPTAQQVDTPNAIPPDGWHVSRGRSEMDDSKTVTLTRRSDDIVSGWIEEQRPTLVIRCKENKTTVFVLTGMAASVENTDGTHSVMLRLDDAPAMPLDASESTDNKGLFLGGNELAMELANAQKLTFKFTPFNASPALVHFDLRGLSDHLHEVAVACGWSG